MITNHPKTDLPGWVKFFPVLFFLFLVTKKTAAQCTVGTTVITWQSAVVGSATVVPSFGTAGGPPAPITDQTVGCGTNMDFTMSISDPNNLYDRRRSGTSGTTLNTYGTPYYTIWMDNLDGGCGVGTYSNPPGGCTNTQNAPYTAGGKIIITFSFQYPVRMVNFRVDDIDAADNSNPPAGSSSFQDRIVFSATSEGGAVVPVSLSVGTPGLVTIAGQTATANWSAGANNNVSPDDPLGQVTASTAVPIKTFTMEYEAGPNEINPAQQAIRLGQFTICCPLVVGLSGNVFNDVNGLVGDANVNGAGLGNPNGETLYANLTDPVTGNVIAVAMVNPDGTYNFPTITGETNYNIVLSTTMGTVGSAAPSVLLPTGWVNTGEDCCDNVGNDASTDGIVSVTVGTSSVTNANFGIQRLPESAFNLQPNQVNVAGFVNYPVPAGAFQTNNVGATPNTQDYDGGTVSSIRITAFPANANTITINGTIYINGGTCPPATTCVPWPGAGVIVPYTDGVGPSQTISVDPIDINNFNIVIPFASIDNAGREDPTPGSVTLPFTGTLPVTLVSFTAIKNGDIATLKWKTENERSLLNYELQWSNNGTNWQTVAVITASGQSEYGSVQQLSAGFNYFRLKPVDLDGRYTYSNVLRIKKEGNTDFLVYPNPATNHFTINIPGAAPADVRLFNSAGVQVLRQTNNGNYFTVNVHSLPSGFYTLEVSRDGETYRKKMIIR